MKKFLIYALLLIGFFIFSNFLISVGLNSTYQDIQREDHHSEITVYQAEATYVNGRIRGILTNTKGENLQGKFLEIELYSKRDVLLGRSYIEIDDIKKDETQNFELLFKAKEVDHYQVGIVEEKQPGQELEIIPREWTRRRSVSSNGNYSFNLLGIKNERSISLIFWIYIESFIMGINYHARFGTIWLFYMFYFTKINRNMRRIFGFTVISSNLTTF